MIRIGILTSSRADYGIYLPLLKTIENAADMELHLIVFGTHISKNHGYTIDHIKRDGFPILKIIDTSPTGDLPADIALSYGMTVQKFVSFWNEEADQFDLVFALGDRYEMAAAVAASIPFGIRIAHIHGGETTLGAIDNIYRHSISLASCLHFVSTESYKFRLIKLLDNSDSLIFNVGSLSLENLEQMELLSKEEFRKQWNIDLEKPTILVTVHPETVNYRENEQFMEVISETILNLAKKHQIVITLPNADTMGNLFRNRFIDLSNVEQGVIFTVDNFGTQSYFTCMKYAQILIGNTSSGIIEAASFNRYVINVGNRQKGRLCGENVINVSFEVEQILHNVNEYKSKVWDKGNLYFQEQPSNKILNILRSKLEKL